MYKKYFGIFLMLNAVIAVLFFTEALNVHTGETKKEALAVSNIEENIMINDKQQTEVIEIDLPKAVSHPRIIDEETLIREKMYHLSDAEYNLLLKLVEAEAGGEDIEGKILVANVVFNRVASVKFPNTVTGVILQQDGSGAQFSPISDGRIDSVVVSEETQKAVDEVIYGEDLSQGALYFVARTSANEDKLKWFDSCLTPVLAHDGHEFFK